MNYHKYLTYILSSTEFKSQWDEPAIASLYKAILSFFTPEDFNDHVENWMLDGELDNGDVIWPEDNRGRFDELCDRIRAFHKSFRQVDVFDNVNYDIIWHNVLTLDKECCFLHAFWMIFFYTEEINKEPKDLGHLTFCAKRDIKNAIK